MCLKVASDSFVREMAMLGFHANLRTEARLGLNGLSAVWIASSFVGLNIAINGQCGSSWDQRPCLTFHNKGRVARDGILEVLCFMPFLGRIKENPAPWPFNSEGV